ncbi:hypothetical protein LJC27_02950 [Christensenellaceae bacterium OttesenSCG-928-M15]|nr:hypothetical protein [Christensenellaceae bacterium OttesenSCG-928-M15]
MHSIEDMNNVLATKGIPLNRIIWRLAWPIVLLSIIERLAGIYEGLLVSVNSTAELLIISLCSPYHSLIVTVGYGLSIGINAVVGTLLGKGEWQGTGRTATKLMLLLLLACGVLMSCMIYLLLPVSFQSPEAAGLYSGAIAYLLPTLLGSPVLLLYGAIIAGMRGMGHTRAGMWMTLISVPFQLALSYVLYHRMGLIGLGLGLLLARAAGCLLGIALYTRELWRLGVHRAASPKKGLLKDILRLCIPASLSKAVNPVAQLLMNGLLLTLGAVAVSAKGLGGRMEMFFYITAVGISPVALTLVSQYKATRDLALLRRLSLRLVLWSVLPTAALFIPAAIFAPQLWALLTPDAALQAAGVIYFRIFGASYPLVAADMAFASILSGLGTSAPMLWSTILRAWGITLPGTALAIACGWGAAGVWWAFFLGNLAAALFSGIWLWRKLYVMEGVS